MNVSSLNALSSTKSGVKSKSLAVCALALVVSFSSASAMADPASRAERLFNRVDQNQDTFVSVDEMVAVAQKKSSRAFNFLDANDDQVIQLAEAEARRENVLGLLGGADPAVGAEIRECVEAELGVALPELPQPGAAFAAADVDDSDTIDRAEWDAAVEAKVAEKFGLVDTNNDLLVDITEFKAGLQKKHALKHAMRQCVSTLMGFGI